LEELDLMINDKKKDYDLQVEENKKQLAEL